MERRATKVDALPFIGDSDFDSEELWMKKLNECCSDRPHMHPMAIAENGSRISGRMGR